MIYVKDLSYSYALEPIFSGVSFSVTKNCKVGLVGPNGSGKSTLFKLLAKREMPDEGKIEITGEVVLVPQEVKKDEVMECSNNIRAYLDPKKQKQDFELTKMLYGLELNNKQLDDPPLQLSGGQKTKLAIAKALLDEPEI
ncbi:MAG: ATP-binding cassette domain-containing protein, partial [Candidatus Shapirobacteria bacterium]